jgi:NAD(P)H-dependent FMN reductase
MKKQKNLLIVAHAPSPNTIALRTATVSGATYEEIENINVIMRSPLEATAEDVINSQAIILGTTENLGYMSGALKDFFDRIYYPCLEETQGMPFAAYIRAGHDGTGTQRGIQSITTGLKWRLVQNFLVFRGSYNERFASDCKELGMTVAASLETGVI